MFGALNLKPQSPEDWASEVEEPTLIVGDLLRWSKNGRRIQTFDHFHFSSFAELSEETLAIARPSIVLSPLMADTFDAIDVANQLSAMRYKGLYRAIASENVNAKVICADVRAHAPNLDFDVLVVPDLTNTRGL